MTVKDRVGRVRYVLFRVEAEPRPSRSALVRAVQESASAALGAEGAAGAAIWLTSYAEGIGLLRVRHTHARAARDVLAAVQEAGGRPVRLVPVTTSGTARSARARTPRA